MLGRASALVTSAAQIVLASGFSLQCTQHSHTNERQEGFYGTTKTGPFRQDHSRVPAVPTPNGASLHRDETPQRGILRRRRARGLPELADYPEYGSATFAEAADCSDEDLSQPDPAPPSPTPPNPTQPDCEMPANDPAGRDGPVAGNSLPASTATSRTN